jgi:nucleoside-diphosphate-sugar epimerase
LNILVTGATGYIGGAILRLLAAEGMAVTGGVRAAQILPGNAEAFVTGDLSHPHFLLPPVDVVIHAAGLGHRRGMSAETWRRANVDAAVNLARAAREAGAKRFILISTAHIHGRVHPGVVTDSSPPNPMDGYAASKLQAEHDVAATFGPGLSIIRPVAVIGPACPGNIPLLLKLISKGIPLPLGAIENRRSFIHVEDLARLVMAVIQAERLPESVLAAQPETIGTPDIIRALAQGLGVKGKLSSFPPELLATGAKLLGRGAMWQSLAGNFVANPVAARALGWEPAQTLEESFILTARYYNTTHGKA